MNALASRIATLIATQGPISIAQFMTIAMHDRKHGYYATRDPLGAGGDFVTAPEISQMFGELLGLWCAQCWRDQGCPGRARLIELGPGRASLMRDALRAARTLPGFLQSLEVVLVEASPALISLQRDALAGVAVPVVWKESFDGELFDRPCFVLANEFFDALPVRQFVYRDGGWHERLVTLDGDQLTFGLAPAPAPLAADSDPPPGAVLEISAPADALAAQMAHGIAALGGAALIVDYGHNGAFGETLQAVRRHTPVDVLASPGEADLSSHVDFSALSASAASEGVAVCGPIPQSQFLQQLGIAARADALSRHSPTIIRDLERLTSPQQMGSLFKAMAIVPKSAPIPAGFTG
ncbi:MAG: SAM-dependent methyltransferase [Alphaproteobacteria bacterium]|nr:SAM-dependent methyltransferase [Alphaproteobacteria bacterium]